MRMAKVANEIIYRIGINLIMKLYVKESAYVDAVFISILTQDKQRLTFK